MSHQFADRDINEIFTGYVSWSKDYVLHINYIAPTQSTYYTRDDLLRLIEIIDGKEEGVMRK
jgi:hypothetical protein